MNTHNDIFVSYASEDRARVAPLVQRLERFGFSVWWDRDIAHGQNYHLTIEAALDQAKCVVVVWTRDSVRSEWVLNEASAARKRNVLLPVTLDEVEPPLEFRHLQTADLRDENANRGAEYRKLENSVAQLVNAAPRAAGSAASASVRPQRSLHTRVFALGMLLLGFAALLLVFRQLGWIGKVQDAPTAANEAAPPMVATGVPQHDAEATQVPARTSPGAGFVDEPVPARAPSMPPAAARINLFDPQNGAQVVAAAEENWRNIVAMQPVTCTSLSARSFVVIELRDDPPARFDTLAVHVDYSSDYNLKTLAVLVAARETGPFTEAAEFEVPNYRNMRTPFHEFRFAPVTARFVKLEIRGFYHGAGPNGYVCSMRLLAAG